MNLLKLNNHKCYIQRVEDVEDDENDDDEEEEKKLPPLMGFADIECLIEPTQEGKQLFMRLAGKSALNSSFKP